MFEYLKLKAKIKRLSDKLTWEIGERALLLEQIKTLKSQIANYREFEAERKRTRETHRQEMLSELEIKFLNNPNITILDAIRFYSEKPYNPYGAAPSQQIYSSPGGLIPYVGGGF